MIRDLARARGAAPILCDVCVIGAGPAGIALARELGQAGVDTVLLESGGARFERETHDLNRGEVLDEEAHGPLEAYRRRRFGGATTSWGGRCAPFDAVDFEARPHVPHSGWPISRAALAPHYQRAHDYCDLGPCVYTAAEALPGPARAMIPGLVDREVAEGGLYLFSPPTDFGAKFGPELRASGPVQVLLHAECARLVTNREGTAVQAAEVLSPGGHRVVIVARRFVLAAGGLEVVRLLLRSNDVHASGLGNARGLVGRFYMCHVIHRFEVEASSPDVVWDYETTRHGVYCQRALGVRPERQAAHGLLNHRAHIEQEDLADPAHRSGVLSAAYLVKSMLASPAAEGVAGRADALSRGILRRGQARAGQYGEHLANVARDARGVLRFGGRWARQRVFGARQLPSIVLPSPSRRYTLRLDAEQAPCSASRVTLGEATDAFGHRRLRVDWRCTSLDGESALRAVALLGAALERCGAGRVLSTPAFVPEATGGHHLGTTRMSADPARGVVDEEGRVHGVANLYVASTSVFPTSSYANPTLTLLALTLRLADHLQLARAPAEVGQPAAAAVAAAE